MKTNKYTNTKTVVTTNLIGEISHRSFLQIQATYGLAHRGGVQFPSASSLHATRLISDVNILTARENKQLIFSESIFSN